MTVTLEEFIRTGTLGPLVIGMSLRSVIDSLGDPQGTSRKANPLQLKYGSAHLSLWKSPQTPTHRLREITVMFQPAFEPLPNPIAFTDWAFHQAPTEEEFVSFTKQIGYYPVEIAKGPSNRDLSFASGVMASIVNGMLHSVRFLEREARHAKAMPIDDDREPSESQIYEMLDEADRAKIAGAHRAALLLTWAAVEAALRRRVQRVGGLAKVGRQPAILIHELLAARALTKIEHAKVEHFRQLRSSIAHGLAPSAHLNINDLEDVRSLVTRLLSADDAVDAGTVGESDGLG